MATSPSRFSERTRSPIRSAVDRERSSSSATPGCVREAAQARGTPLETVAKA